MPSDNVDHPNNAESRSQQPQAPVKGFTALTAPLNAQPSRVMSLSFLRSLVIPLLWIKPVIAEIYEMRREDSGTDWTSVFSTSAWECKPPNIANLSPPWQIHKLDDAPAFQVALSASPAEIETSLRSGLGTWDLPPFMSPPNDCQSRLIEVLQFLGSKGVGRANIVGKPAHLAIVEWWRQNQL
ncbi:hypothetical protein DL765_005820 [Monosporascus sp. GIB2]|nr:hypothetical protein DL765_005820 [Monosporascus sp. GIB2]